MISYIDSGKIGARDRDQIRTLRATEAAIGVAPERGILPRTRTTPRGAARTVKPAGDFLEVTQIEEIVEQAEQAYSRLSLSDQIDNVINAVLPEINRRRGRKPPVTAEQAKKSVLEFRESLPVEKGKLRPRDTFDRAFKTLRRDELSQREALDYKDVSLKIPEIAVSTILLKDGLITRKQRNAVVNKFKPVTPYESLPNNLLTTKEKAINAPCKIGVMYAP